MTMDAGMPPERRARWSWGGDAEGGGRRAEAELRRRRGPGAGRSYDPVGLPRGGGDGGADLLEEREVGLELRHEHEQPVGQRVRTG